MAIFFLNRQLTVGGKAIKKKVNWTLNLLQFDCNFRDKSGFIN